MGICFIEKYYIGFGADCKHIFQFAARKTCQREKKVLQYRLVEKETDCRAAQTEKTAA